jgi:uncharacterized protein (TIGR03663 family)
MAPSTRKRQETGPELSMELALYALSFALALALRLHALERWPLVDGEAGLALAAWRWARGLPAVLRGHSPVLFHLNAVALYFTSGSDALVRVWSVLFGSCLVLWPYGLRQRLGRAGALVSSILLALSPSFTYFSRTADGTVVAAFCALGLLVAVDGYMRERRAAYVYLSAVLGALAFLSGPALYTILAMLGAFALFLVLRFRRGQDPALHADLHATWEGLRAEPSVWRVALLVAGMVFLTLGTGLAANPAGLQMALDQFGQWVGGWSLLRGSTWYLMAQLLFQYETLTLVLGLAGLALAIRRMRKDGGDLLSVLLPFWVVFALAFSVVPGYRPASGLWIALLPLTLAAGWAAEALYRQMQPAWKQPWMWALVAVSLGLAAAAYVQLVIYLGLPATAYLMRMAALGVLLISVYAMIWSWLGPQIPLRAAGLSVLILLVLLTVRTEVLLNYVRARDPVELIVGRTTAPDVLELAQSASKLSSQLQGDPRIMAWQVDETLEVPLGWYLRDFTDVRFVSRVPSNVDVAGIILRADAPAPAHYAGVRYRLHAVWPGGNVTLLDWLRWWIGYRSGLLPQAADEAILWVRLAGQ